MGGTAIGELPGLGTIPEALITAEGAVLGPLWTIGKFPNRRYSTSVANLD